MAQNVDKWRVDEMVRVLKVSRSGYYAWRKREPSKRAIANEKLKYYISSIHKISRQVYGLPRIQAELKSINQPSNHKRVRRLMRELGVRAKQKRKYRNTTDSKHSLPVAKDLVCRDFNPEQQDRIWAADISYIWTHEGWLYLAVILDLFSRRVIGWAMADNMRTGLVLSALDMAIKTRNLKNGADLIHHSDRGSQYASDAYQQRLLALEIKPSMSRKGDCWDNAPMESFWGTLKQELIYHERFATREEAMAKIFEYVEVFYNRQRRHSSTDFKSPAEFERLAIVS